MNYYPLIRGRQADLLALRAAVQTGLSPHIIPVIEPVKDNAALPSTVAAFAAAEHPLFVIANPQVGTYGLLAAPRHPLPAPLPPPVQAARYFDAQPAPLIIAGTPAEAAALPARQLRMVPNEARFRVSGSNQAIYLGDWHPSRERTEAYRVVQRELYQYPKATLAGRGWADYPLSSHHYSEQGYPQRAIALHLLFPSHGALYWQHFTSVNNADFSQPQAKFFEAVTPLAAWLAVHPEAATPATSELLQLLAQHHFPGLGKVRELQLRHLFTIIGRWLAD